VKNCAWITGASQGLGRALALELARSGQLVIASARSEDKLVELSKEAEDLAGQIVPWIIDVTDAQLVAQAIREIESKIGKIETAVLNAGTHLPVSGRSLKAADFRELIEINVMGTLHCLEPIIAAMKVRGCGRIAVFYKPRINDLQACLRLS
jgi:NADP-dependent 3-hydroxy acid dehydrogenase YdfG